MLRICLDFKSIEEMRNHCECFKAVCNIANLGCMEITTINEDDSIRREQLKTEIEKVFMSNTHLNKVEVLNSLMQYQINLIAMFDDVLAQYN
jgi:hypothetical protein